MRDDEARGRELRAHHARWPIGCLLSLLGVPALLLALLVLMGGSGTGYVGVAAMFWAVIGVVPMALLFALCLPKWPFPVSIATGLFSVMVIAINATRPALGAGVLSTHVDDAALIPLELGFATLVAVSAAWHLGWLASPRDSDESGSSNP